MAAKTVGTRNRTKLTIRGELGTMEKFMMEKGPEVGRRRHLAEKQRKKRDENRI